MHKTPIKFPATRSENPKDGM